MPTVVVTLANIGVLLRQGLEAALSPATKAVIPVHMCGAMARIDEIKVFCDKQGLILLEAAAVTSDIIAARFVEPGGRILRHLVHGPVAIDAVYPVLAGGHDVTQAFGLGARVAVVATLQGIRYLAVMLLVHGMG